MNSTKILEVSNPRTPHILRYAQDIRGWHIICNRLSRIKCSMLQSRAGGSVAERQVARCWPRGTSGDACTPAPHSNRSNKLKASACLGKLWSEEQMSLAVEAVRSGETGIWRAHQEFSVPKCTLLGGCKREQWVGPRHTLPSRWQSFWHRHPEIVLRNSEALSCAR